jgi:hypothetical protein
MTYFTRSVSVMRASVKHLALYITILFAFESLATNPAPAANASTNRALQSDPSVVGQWSPVSQWPLVAIHTHLLPNGKVLTWQRKDSELTTQTYLWDPATNGFTQIFNPYTHLFCSGHSFLPDGRLLVTGGHHFENGVGEPHTNIFDPNTNIWSRVADMNAGRWYPTTCALGNGETLVVSGHIDSTQGFNTLPQVWQTSGGWRSLTGAQMGIQLYPWMLLAPDGRVFNAGPDQATRFLTTSGTGQWENGPASNYGFRDYGSSVMYDDGKVLIVGGGAPTNTAEVINLSSQNPEWRSVSPMAFGRRQMNATLLPDGKVLVTGGSSSPGFNNATKAVLAAEMWDPSTEAWSTMSSMQVMRLYHSTALLLPDGRVLSAGGGLPPSPNARDTDHPDVEIYSPPYLFKGPRPSITSSPAAVTHGHQFFIGTPDATGITKVTLIRLSSVTHAFNQSQRINILSYRQTPGGLSVRAPGSGNLCPPGYYMLFIINGNGVPSVAQIVQVRSPASATNAVDDQRFFVRQLYYDVLGREPDQAGWNGWMSYIDQCGNDQQCLMNNRGITARSFMDLPEFRRNKPALTNPGTPEYNQELVRQCYLVFLRREPDPNGYNAWLNYLNSTRDETAVVNGFIHSAEYRNRFSKP